MCILSDAQLFLNNLNGLFGANVIYKAFTDKSQDVLDSYWRIQNSLFISAFFGKNSSCQKDEKSLHYFVITFNTLIMALHIKAKLEESRFLPTSPISFPPQKTCISCYRNEFEDDGDSLMCLNCGLFIRQCYAASWNDITRVYIAPIYTYNRRAQFKEYILQYQGRCIRIDYSILDKLLIPRDKLCSKKEFLDILRTSIKDKLCIDHIHALYYRFFNKPPPNISHVTYELLVCFDKFFAAYNNILWQNRSINDKYVSNQFLLYQFLNNMGISTTLDDVLVNDNLSNSNQKFFNDIFGVLNWQMF